MYYCRKTTSLLSQSSHNWTGDGENTGNDSLARYMHIVFTTLAVFRSETVKKSLPTNPPGALEYDSLPFIVLSDR